MKIASLEDCVGLTAQAYRDFYEELLERFYDRVWQTAGSGIGASARLHKRGCTLQWGLLLSRGLGVAVLLGGTTQLPQCRLYVHTALESGWEQAW